MFARCCLFLVALLAPVVTVFAGGPPAKAAPAGTTTVSHYDGTMTTTIQLFDRFLNPAGTITKSYPAFVEVGPPRSTKNGVATETNPFSLVIARPGSTSPVSLAEMAAWSSTIATVQGQEVLFQYWTYSQNGQTFSGTLTNSHTAEGVAVNLVNGLEDFVGQWMPCVGVMADAISGWGAATISGSFSGDQITVHITGTAPCDRDPMLFDSTITATRPATPPPPTTIAVEGSDQALYVNHGSGYTFLGGVLAAAPAAVSLPGAGNLYIVTGTDHRLWERTDTLPWQPLAGGYCIDNPAATVSGSTLIVSCTSSDYGLYLATAAIPGNGLPILGGWTPYGGASTFGPAVAVVNGAPTLFAVGLDGRLYWRTANQTWTPFANTWCTGHPAAATSGSTSYAACHGGDNAFWYTSNSGSGWSGFQSLGGGLIDGPAIAGTSAGPVFFAEGSDTAVYERTLTTGWQYIGGGVLHGVAATAG